MRLAIVGGGGVTTPLVVTTIARNADVLGLKEIVLFDINYDRLALVLPLINSLIEAGPSKFRIIPTDDIISHANNLDAVILSVRPGLEQGRATDERICKTLGLLANETIGAAGFAFACRAIPVVLRYAQELSQANPDVWFINFTNPAGIVTQALRDSGHQCVVGVCSSADRVLRCVAEHLGISRSNLTSRVFGLNHLSWTGEVHLQGENITKELLTDQAFLRICQPWFPSEFVREKGLLLNEYLYFFYFHESAILKQNEKPLTRGEEILEMNYVLRKELSYALSQRNYEAAINGYLDYVRQRKGTYMANLVRRKLSRSENLDEGYSGVALGVLRGLFGGHTERLALCVPLGVEYPGLLPNDIVEITCILNQGAIIPIHSLELSEEDRHLVSSVKAFERETVAAVLHRSIERARRALNLHPLLNDSATSHTFLEHIMNQYPDVFRNWR